MKLSLCADRYSSLSCTRRNLGSKDTMENDR
jgi:hypothetical protein